MCDASVLVMLQKSFGYRIYRSSSAPTWGCEIAATNSHKLNKLPKPLSRLTKELPSPVFIDLCFCLSPAPPISHTSLRLPVQTSGAVHVVPQTAGRLQTENP